MMTCERLWQFTRAISFMKLNYQNSDLTVIFQEIAKYQNNSKLRNPTLAIALLSIFGIYINESIEQLEQLERLRFENTPAAPSSPIILIHIRSQVEQDKVKVTSLKNLKVTHLKLINKMCKYEMDPVSIVEVTERPRFCPQTDGQTDGRRETRFPPFNFIEVGV